MSAPRAHLPPAALAAAFPWFIACDDTLRLTEVGPALGELLGDAAAGRSFFELFEIHEPIGVRCANDLRTALDRDFLVVPRRGQLPLRGRWVALPDTADGGPGWLFLARRGPMGDACAVPGASEFLASFGPEVLGPLTPLLTLCRSLLEGAYGPMAPSQRAPMQVLLQSAEQLTTAVEALLLCADRAKRGARPMDAQSVDMRLLCHRLVERMRPRLAEQGHVLFFEDRLGANARLTGDAVLLDRALGALLDGAERGAGNGARLGLALEPGPRPGTLAVSVLGVSTARPGERRPRPRPPEQRSRGVGDAREVDLEHLLARLVADAHGGSVHLEDRAGAFQVRLVLPARQEPAVRSDAPKVRILVAEDEPAIGVLYTRTLEAAGFETSLVNTGAGVVERAIRWQPALILLDLLLPELSGWQVLRLLRANPATVHIPIAVISCLDDAKESLRLGASGHYSKPLGRGQLDRIVHTLLNPTPAVAATHTLEATPQE